MNTSSDASRRPPTATGERSTLPAIDDAYRQVVRAAAGGEHLRRMTERCLVRVDALVARGTERASRAPSLRRDLHRLAGATAAVGLPSLAATLRALQQAYERPGAPGLLPGLWGECAAASLAARGALAAEAS